MRQRIVEVLHHLEDLVVEARGLVTGFGKCTTLKRGLCLKCGKSISRERVQGIAPLELFSEILPEGGNRRTDAEA